MTDRDDEPAQAAARGKNANAEGRQKGGKPRDRDRERGTPKGGERADGQKGGKKHDQQGRAAERSGKKADQVHVTAAADASDTGAGDRGAGDKDQARDARRAANQRAREAARAERQAERARRKQDRAATKAAQGKSAPDDKDDRKAAGRRAAERDRKHRAVSEADEDADRKAARGGRNKPGQAKVARSAQSAKAGFVPFATEPDAPPAAASVPVAQGSASTESATGELPGAADAGADDIESQPFNILLIAQSGALARQAVIFAASLRMFSPKWRGRLIVAEPQPDGAWSGVSTRIGTVERDLLSGFGAEILPFTAQHFGRAYPYGNKIEALALLPAGEPFVFFDSDTIITGPLGPCAIDFSRPTASMRREGSWPEPPLYGPGFTEIWRSLYDRFGLEFETSLDRDQPDEHWERYLYFNAGWFLGADPAEFGRRFLDWSLAVRNEPGEALASQSLDPWLDQVVLPLVVHSLGGGRPGPELDAFDNGVTCHYRNPSLLYARESDGAIAAMERVLALPDLRPLVAQDAGFAALVRDRAGRDRIRPIYAGKPLPSKEKAIRQELKKQGLWFGR